jgi:hypothetical protein
MTEDPGTAADPDQELPIPAREARAALGIVEGILSALTADETLASQLASSLPPLPASARLPEVGQVRDADTLKLHSFRIAARLVPYIPGAADVNGRCRPGRPAGSELARTLSVIVRGFTRPGPRAHGHMADRACREDHCQAHMRRSGGI